MLLENSKDHVLNTRSPAIYPTTNCLLHSKPFQKKIDNIEVPKNIEEALKRSEWRNVILEEMNALKKNETCEITDLPKGKQPVDCKWIFTVKYKYDGSIERHKACLVTKGFTQIFRVDSTETSSPVAKLDIIRILLSLATNIEWPLYQLVVKKCFFEWVFG